MHRGPAAGVTRRPKGLPTALVLGLTVKKTHRRHKAASVESHKPEAMPHPFHPTPPDASRGGSFCQPPVSGLAVGLLNGVLVRLTKRRIEGTLYRIRN